MNIVVLISGSGTNLQAILDACRQGRIAGKVRGVLSNKPDAYGLERARQAGIPVAVVSPQEYPDKMAFEKVMMNRIDGWQPDVVVLAGFMRILSPDFVQHFEGRLLNIHPSLLPLYKGLNTHNRVLAAGDRLHGCSVHYVNAELDGGPVIAQAVIRVLPNDNEQSLSERVHKQEHRLYPLVLSWMASGRLAWRNGGPVLDGLTVSQPLQLMF